MDRDRAVALEPVDAAFDGVAGLAVLAVEGRRASDRRPAAFAVADLVGGFGDGEGKAAPAQ
ncbi:hypothetical protein OG216_05015 [Streptomycetaceae bacterium NBC_01309]